jgi:hypothetical protein
VIPLLVRYCAIDLRLIFLSGKIIGKAELLPETDREAEPSAPFEDFPDSIVDKSGNVIFEGRVVGKLVEGDGKKLEGKKVCVASISLRISPQLQDFQSPSLPNISRLSVIEYKC